MTITVRQYDGMPCVIVPIDMVADFENAVEECIPEMIKCRQKYNGGGRRYEVLDKRAITWLATKYNIG